MRALNRSKTGYNGIILTGGKSTRLGPLAAQISKALVTVDNRPQVINQIMQLRDAGCTQIVVVASPSTYDQTYALIQRCGISVDVVSDAYEQGPVRGIMVGLEYPSIDHHKSTYVMFSDTVISEPLGGDTDESWVGVTEEYDKTRSWCFIGRDGVYRDGVPMQRRDEVTIGVYFFRNTEELYGVASSVMYVFREKARSTAIQMAPLLNEYSTLWGLDVRAFTTWMDVGDIFSLAAARHRKFNGRASHVLTLTRDGILHKNGVSDGEMDFYDSLGERDVNVQTLFPTHYGTDRTLRRCSMEYVDLPTLAELWLYWPGLPQTWAGIVQSLVDRLMHSLWQKEHGENIEEYTAGDWMALKALERLNWYKPEHQLHNLVAELGEIVGDDVWVQGHGDLNFTNILYSINTGNFKLIDPRGGEVPLIYEFAKIAYSPIFSAIVHGLYVNLDNDDTWILPQRQNEVAAVNNILVKYVDERRLGAAIALILLAAPPLHNASEGKVLFDLGYAMGRDILDGE